MIRTRSKRILASLNTALIVSAVALGMQAPLAATSTVMAAGSTPWLDRDNVSGKGDYEDTVNLLKQQCRIKGTKKMIPAGNPVSGMPGYYNKKPFGCWCINKEAGGKCRDIEIKYSW